MDDEVPTLDVIALSESDDPRFGVVRAVVSDGDYTIVLDDLNSDFREVEHRAFRRDEQGWREVFYQEDAGFPAVGHTHGGGWTASSSDDGGYGWTFGREYPGSVVHLLFRGEELSVHVDRDGWWLCIRETADQQFDAPRRWRSPGRSCALAVGDQQRTNSDQHNDHGTSDSVRLAANAVQRRRGRARRTGAPACAARKPGDPRLGSAHA